MLICLNFVKSTSAKRQGISAGGRIHLSVFGILESFKISSTVVWLRHYGRSIVMKCEVKRMVLDWSKRSKNPVTTPTNTEHLKRMFLCFCSQTGTYTNTYSDIRKYSEHFWKAYKLCSININSIRQRNDLGVFRLYLNRQHWKTTDLEQIIDTTKSINA